MPLAIMAAVLLAPIWIPMLPIYLPVFFLDEIFNTGLFEDILFAPLKWLFDFIGLFVA